MTTNNLHIINRLSFELTKDSKKNLDKVKDQSIAILKEKLIPLIEKTLDKYDPEKTIRIDKLEIDLGQIDLKYLEAQLIQQIKAQTILQLDKVFEQKKAKVIKHSLKDTFVYFLKNGTLPWWKNKITIEEFEQSILEDLKANKWKIEDCLKPFDQNILKRIVFQFSDDFFQKLLNQQKVEDSFITDLDQFQKGLEKHFSKRLVRNQIWITSIPEIFSTSFNSTKSVKTIFTKVINNLNIDSNILKTQKSNTKLKLLLRELQDNEYPNLKIENQKSKIKPQVENPKPKISKYHHRSPSNPHYITNAGLILLHPFIVNLFKHLEYTKDKKFIDEYHQHQAALVLQYLCNGETKNPEYNLVLNKIICGIPTSTSIENTLIINKEIKSQCQLLLESSIKHWPVIKTTSPQGLQNTFLNREGKLHQKENDDWKLFIENKTVDILVSKIPWSISMIKLPWMKSILWVDWA